MTQAPKNINLQLEKVIAEKCRRDFYFFVQYFWSTIIAETPVWNWHIKYLCEELQAIGRRVADRQQKEFDYIIINVPPGSSKSTIISEMYPLWCWTIDATQRFICGSYASTPAEDIAEKCYNIYTSDKFRTIFPELTRKTSGGKTHFKNGLLGERYTTSTGSAITGVHAHQKIIDDPMNPKIAASKVERDTANKWISETMGSRNVDANVTVTIVVMQRLHNQDTTGYLLAKQGLRIKHICIPAELSDNVKPANLKEFYVNGLFDPLRKSVQTLISEKAQLGSYGYAGQMQQRPSPEGGGILKKAWFPIVQRYENPPFTTTNFQLDTAYTDDEKNDPTGVLPYYVMNNNIYVTHAISVWKEFPDLIDWLPKHVTEKGYKQNSIIHVEPKASGKSVVQSVKRNTRLNIVESTPPKDDKVTRVHTCSPIIETGRIYLHEGFWNEEFLEQVTTFPNAEHDEYIDCLCAIIEREFIKDTGEYSII